MTRHAPTRPAAALLALLVTAVLLPGCQNPGTPSMSTSKHDTMIKENPAPKQSYRIEMRIENAPGPFSLVEGAAQYDVQNYEECGEINRVSGTISRITVSPEIIWTPKGDGVYEAVVHADRMLDEDYFGRGVCRWAMTEVRASLRATGAKGETRFSPSIVAADVFAGKAATSYFAGVRYPKVETYEDFVDFGVADPSRFKSEFQNGVFTVTFIAKGD